MATFTAGQILTAAELNALLALGKAKKVTASGSVTSTDIPAGQAVLILGWGGGGGSGGVAATTAATNCAGSAGGGSSGVGLTVVAYASVTWPLTVTIGAGGTAGTAGNNAGGTGGSTTVVDAAAVTLLSVGGGGGGGGSAVQTQISLSGTGGTAGSVTTATFSISGGTGGYGRTYSNVTAHGGDGANAPMGGPSTPTPIGTNVRAAVAGTIPGGGAGGASNTGTVSAAAGAAGGRGEVWIIAV